MMSALEFTTHLLAREEGAENNRREEAAIWKGGGRRVGDLKSAERHIYFFVLN